MAETIIDGKWHWYQLPKDLEQQAGYKGIYVDPLSVGHVSCVGGTDKGNKFTLTWRPDRLMMISLLEDEQALIDAFATVVEYKPLCKYRYESTGLITYEWAKYDSKERFEKLQKEDCVNELQLLDESPLNVPSTRETKCEEAKTDDL